MNHKSIIKFYRAILTATLVSASAANAVAQLNEQISVDGRYIPEIITVDKIYSFPARPALTMKSTPLEFDLDGVITDYPPQALTMPALAWGARRTDKHHRGYVSLSLGSWLNSDLSAGYRFADSPGLTAGIWLQGNSTSLWKPELSHGQKADKARKRYDYTLGTYASRRFDGKGLLSADLAWRTAYFNYYAIEERHYDLYQPSMPTQTLNDVTARVSWKSSTANRFPWEAAMEYHGFHYRDFAMLFNAVPFDMLLRTRGSRENRFTLSGGINNRLEAASVFGLDADASLLIYKGGVDSNDRYYNLYSPRNYGMVRLRPFWRMSSPGFGLKVGFEATMTFNARGRYETGRYGVFHISPDVRADFTGNGASVFIHMTGGTRLNTLASLSQLDYYQDPALVTTIPTYSPLDARAGISIGPFSGFSATLEGRYAVERDTPLGGWYTHLLNGNSPFMPGQESVSMSLHGGSVAFSMAYTYGNRLSIKSRFDWQPQKGTIGIFNGYDRPRFTASASLAGRPVRPLSLEIEWNLRACRNIYSYSHKPYALPNISTLNFGAVWSVTDAVAVSARALNLLNRKETILPSLPCEGITFTAGLQIIF